MPKTALVYSDSDVIRGTMVDLLSHSGYRIIFISQNLEFIEKMNTVDNYPIVKITDDIESETSYVKNYVARSAPSDQEINDSDYVIFEMLRANQWQTFMDIKHILNKKQSSDNHNHVSIILSTEDLMPVEYFEDEFEKVLSFREKVYFAQHFTIIKFNTIGLLATNTDFNGSNRLAVKLLFCHKKIPLSKSLFDRLIQTSNNHYIFMENSQNYDILHFYTCNMLRLAYAIHGSAKGYKYLSECYQDQSINEIIKGSLKEVQQAFSKVHKEMSVDEYFDSILGTIIKNGYDEKIEETINDLLHKIKREESLLGAALFCLNHGILPYYLTKTIACVFSSSKNSSAIMIQEYTNYYGVKNAIRKFCELNKEPELIQMIASHYERNQINAVEDINKIEIMRKAFLFGFENERIYRGCAQCTLLAMFDLTGQTDKNLFRSASALAAGMSLTGDGVCGGYSGGLMYIGSLLGRRLDQMKADGDKNMQMACYKLSQKLRERFIETYGTVICSKIHNQIFGRAFCLRTEAVKKEFDLAEAHTKKCTAVVGMASMWLSEILYENGCLSDCNH